MGQSYSKLKVKNIRQVKVSLKMEQRCKLVKPFHIMLTPGRTVITIPPFFSFNFYNKKPLQNIFSFNG